MLILIDPIECMISVTSLPLPAFRYWQPIHEQTKKLDLKRDPWIWANTPQSSAGLFIV